MGPTKRSVTLNCKITMCFEGTTYSQFQPCISIFTFIVSSFAFFVAVPIAVANLPDAAFDERGLQRVAPCLQIDAPGEQMRCARQS